MSVLLLYTAKLKKSCVVYVVFSCAVLGAIYFIFSPMENRKILQCPLIYIYKRKVSPSGGPFSTRKHETLAQRLLTVGPPSTTLCQQQTNVGPCLVDIYSYDYKLA